MATLIPSMGACRFTTGGEKRLAERLLEKLEDDYLLWYDVPIGHANSHPDFIVLHPHRGILILEVKDWKPATIHNANKQSFEIFTNCGIKHETNPLEQARQYAHAVINILQKDPQLTIKSGCKSGHLLFPWSYGVVLTNISRKAFEDGQLDQVIEPGRVICQDEMLESVELQTLNQLTRSHMRAPFSISPYKNRIRLPNATVSPHLLPAIFPCPAFRLNCR